MNVDRVLKFFVYQIHFLHSFLRRPHTDRFPDDVLKKLWRNRNCDSCEKNATGAEKTVIRRIPAGIGNRRCGLIPLWQLSWGFSWPASPSQDLANTALYHCLLFAQVSCLLSLITAAIIEERRQCQLAPVIYPALAVFLLRMP